MYLTLLSSCENDSKKDTILITGILTPNYVPNLGYPPFREPDQYRTSVVVAFFRKEFIDDAIVTLSNGSESIGLVPVNEYEPEDDMFITLFQDTARSIPIVAGQTYHLEVRVPDGRVFHAWTTVPEVPVILSASNGDTIDFKIQEDNGLYKTGFARFDYMKDPRCYVDFFWDPAEDNLSEVITFSVSKTDSIGFLFKDSAIISSAKILATLDSAMSYNSWRFATDDFASDSLYGDLYSATTNVWKKYSNIKGENVVGVFGSYNSTKINYFAKPVY
jgi:hypothetical protein